MVMGADGTAHAGRCGHCKKLAPTWVNLAKQLQHSVTVAEVNCEDHRSLCSTQGVTGFPMLFFYPASGKKTEYTGNRKFEALRDWVEKAVKP
jgi:thioredoxin domain-containing protein 5